MPTASDSATSSLSPTSAAAESATVRADAIDGSMDGEVTDDLGDRLHAMSKCSAADAEQILDLLENPQPLSEQAKAAHEAGLARFAARFRIVDSQ